MIKSIEIENYKNFKHLKMENFKLINFFTGQNDTGKTNLLEALYTNTGLCDPAVQVSLPPEHVVLVSEFRKIKLNNDNLKTFFYQENTANPISIRTEFEHATIPLTIQFDKGVKKRLLEQSVENYHEKSECYLASPHEAQILEKYLKGE